MKLRECTYKVYPTPPSHIVNNPPKVTSLVKINHVIDPAGPLPRLKYAVNTTMLGKHLVITCATLIGITKNFLTLPPVSRNRLWISFKFFNLALDFKASRGYLQKILTPFYGPLKLLHVSDTWPQVMRNGFYLRKNLRRTSNSPTLMEKNVVS